MPQASGLLCEGKPLIEVTIADAMPIPGEVSPQATHISFSLRPYRALLDTGADITCVCDHVIAECKLRPYGFLRMIGGLGPSLHTTHIVRLGILCDDQNDFEGQLDAGKSLFQLDPLEAAAIRDNQWFDVLIGTDIIAQHELTLTKGGGFRFTLG